MGHTEMIMLEGKNTKSRDVVDKLQKQFAHLFPEKLIRLVRQSGITDKKLEREINSVTKQCITCLKHRRTPPRPVVSLPMSSKFNDVVAMDLKSWGKSYFLVMVDMATRFCTATIVHKKTFHHYKRSLYKLDNLFWCSKENSNRQWW